MSRSLGPDMTASRGLGALDPALELPRALHRTGSSWRLHDASWQVGAGCRLVFLVQRPGAQAGFVTVEAAGTGARSADYRDDPCLPGLVAASDATWVAERLVATLDQPVRYCRVEPVRYRPGSRCVWRYQLRTASGEVVLFAKAWDRATFVRAARHLTLLDASRAGRRLVPPVVAVWPDVQVMVNAAVPGRAASSVLGDRAVPAAGRVALAHRLGGLLARLHAVPDVDAPVLSVSGHVASLADALPVAGCVDAALAARWSGLVDVLTQQAPEDEATVLGHGAFRAGQVVRSDTGRLVVLDVDGLCRSAAERDLGTALAHLRWQSVRLQDQRDVLRAAEAALCDGYLAAGGGIDPDSLSWWRAAGLLQVVARRYRRFEVTDWPAVPALLDAAADALRSGRPSRPGPRGIDLLDPVRMTSVLRPALAAVTSSPHEVSVATAEPLSGASSRRAVVRYALRGRCGDGPAPVTGKWFADAHRARLLHEHLVLLHEGPFGRGTLRVPEPLGLLQDQRLVLYRHCAGTPVDRIGDPARAAEGVRNAAVWLARLHTSTVSLPRRLSVQAEAESVRRWATVVGTTYPELADSAHGLAAAWDKASRTLPAVADVPIHKDFHAGHVLLGEKTWVVDLDEARMGDPAFDVAHFCAYLQLSSGGETAARLVGLFVRDYRAATGWRDCGSLRPFRAYTWLKIAKQWAMATGPGRDASPAERISGAAQALGRGWTCLSGSSTSCAAGRGSPRPSS